ncbi:YkvA family protein [Colwellia sp. MB3u-4]|uniref:YkvA family protein n=1 Tax=Colwellia sp. MB3u-4 TaxID=2759822 RepID=UPI0015F46A9C|nr:DUF1232 domain-containing protein [Colwellia sp. MB3u-4]MBA6290222.1 DUF1232 domain-containing protein [Colwellia sp. MB3u-4]
MNLTDIRIKANLLKKQTIIVYYVSRDPRLPVHIKILAILIAAYALSPIDLIPDFIPIIGLLDDIIIIPLGLALIIKLTPSHIIDNAKRQAEYAEKRPISYTAAVVFIIIWLTILYIFGRWFYHLISNN